MIQICLENYPKTKKIKNGNKDLRWKGMKQKDLRGYQNVRNAKLEVFAILEFLETVLSVETVLRKLRFLKITPPTHQVL